MTLRQESKLSMYLAVKSYLANNLFVLSPLPNYATFSTAFLAGVVQVQTFSEQQMFDKSGLQVNKAQLKATVVSFAADASRKVQAYAKFTNNQLLLSETKFSESDLKTSSDNELRDNAQGLYDRVQTNLAALASYGLNAASQTALLNAINAFVTAIPSPRIGKADKKSSTAQLAMAFKNTDIALANIDSVVEIVRTSQANFYAEYRSVRKVIDTGKGSLSMKGMVSDALSGDGLKGAKLVFTAQTPEGMLKAAKATVAVVKKTADKGGFYIKTLPDGMYSVSITKVGYAPQEATVAVSAGELTVLDVQLSKS